LAKFKGQEQTQECFTWVGLTRKNWTMLGRLATFVHAKRTIFKPTLDRTLNEIWQSNLKDFLNLNITSQPNFTLFHLVHEQNHSLCMNIAVTYLLGTNNQAYLKH